MTVRDYIHEARKEQKVNGRRTSRAFEGYSRLFIFVAVLISLVFLYQTGVVVSKEGNPIVLLTILPIGFGLWLLKKSW
jgi:hypothetical protein